MAAATRTSFRPRPLDNNKQLEIVRDENADLQSAGPIDQADIEATRRITNGHETLDAHNEKVLTLTSEKGKGGQEIPIPVVTEVASYSRDYLPTYRERPVYVRGRGGVGYRDDNLVEYDMDAEDNAWLEKLNGDQNRLPQARFELMIWRLETTNAAAIDCTFAAAGAAPQERMAPAVVASTDHMSRDEALASLAAACPARDMLRLMVYDYWLKKRKARGKPLLRSLQAPTPSADQNPANCFRPRERIHRPQTRRRKENNEEAMEKMRMVQANLTKARDLVEALLRRERKKRDVVYVETDAQQLQIKLRHEPRPAAEGIEADYAAAGRAKPGRRPLGFEVRTGLAPGGAIPLEGPSANGASSAVQPDAASRRAKRRKRDARNPQRDAIAQVGWQPWELTDALLAPMSVELPRLCAALGEASMKIQPQLTATLGAGRGRPRPGRGGRLIIDRCHPFTYEQYGLESEDGVPPLHQLPNPYGSAKPSTPRNAPTGGGAMPTAAPDKGQASQPTEPLPPAVTPKPSRAAPATPNPTRSSTRKAAGRDTRGGGAGAGSGPPKRGPGRPPKSGLKTGSGGTSPMDIT